MPRVAWSRLTVALIAVGALTLVSCLQDVGECPTCPGVNSGRIEVRVQRNGVVDSVYATLDAGTPDTLRRDPRADLRFTYEDLSAGTHEVTLVRWLMIDGLVTSSASTLRIELDRGETRVILFHNDFPLVAWAPAPDPGRTDGYRARPLIAPGTG